MSTTVKMISINIEDYNDTIETIENGTICFLHNGESDGLLKLINNIMYLMSDEKIAVVLTDYYEYRNGSQHPTHHYLKLNSQLPDIPFVFRKTEACVKLKDPTFRTVLIELLNNGEYHEHIALPLVTVRK